MLLTIGLYLGLWGFGIVFKVPRLIVWRLSLALYGLIFVALLVLPRGNPLRHALGGEVLPWAVIGGVLLLAWLYRLALRKLRTRAQADAMSEPQETRPETKPTSFTSSELERYARHIVMREIGGLGQRKLKEARVLVIGAGGLGAPCLQYLASSGVGTIGIIDPDRVDNANLQRQVLYRDAQIGMPKVFAAQESLKAQNPHVTIRSYHRRFTDDIAAELIEEYDLIVEGSDDFATKALANKIAVSAQKSIIIGALSPWEGQVSVYAPHQSGPCYNCIFPQEPAAGLAPSCAEAGVFAPLTGIIGTVMAGETLKLIIDTGSVLIGDLMIYDAQYGETRKIRTQQRGDCPICQPKT